MTSEDAGEGVDVRCLPVLRARSGPGRSREWPQRSLGEVERGLAAQNADMLIHRLLHGTPDAVRQQPGTLSAHGWIANNRLSPGEHLSDPSGEHQPLEQ